MLPPRPPTTFEQVFLTPQYLAITMEYGDVGSLLSYLQAQPEKRLPEPSARWLFQQLVIGLSYMHQRVSGRAGVVMGSGFGLSIGLCGSCKLGDQRCCGRCCYADHRLEVRLASCLLPPALLPCVLHL